MASCNQRGQVITELMLLLLSLMVVCSVICMFLEKTGNQQKQYQFGKRLRGGSDLLRSAAAIDN